MIIKYIHKKQVRISHFFSEKKYFLQESTVTMDNPTRIIVNLIKI